MTGERPTRGSLQLNVLRWADSGEAPGTASCFTVFLQYTHPEDPGREFGPRLHV
jgi:hypothetical protein